MTEPADKENETAAIAYVVLNLWPMGRDVGAARNRLMAIGYFRKVQYGANHISEMFLLQNLTKADRRGKGPAKRKPPKTAEDMNHIYDMVGW